MSLTKPLYDTLSEVRSRIVDLDGYVQTAQGKLKGVDVDLAEANKIMNEIRRLFMAAEPLVETVTEKVSEPEAVPVPVLENTVTETSGTSYTVTASSEGTFLNLTSIGAMVFTDSRNEKDRLVTSTGVWRLGDTSKGETTGTLYHNGQLVEDVNNVNKIKIAEIPNSDGKTTVQYFAWGKSWLYLAEEQDGVSAESWIEGDSFGEITLPEEGTFPEAGNDESIGGNTVRQDGLVSENGTDAPVIDFVTVATEEAAPPKTDVVKLLEMDQTPVDPTEVTHKATKGQIKASIVFEDEIFDTDAERLHTPILLTSGQDGGIPLISFVVDANVDGLTISYSDGINVTYTAATVPCNLQGSLVDLEINFDLTLGFAEFRIDGEQICNISRSAIQTVGMVWTVKPLGLVFSADRSDKIWYNTLEWSAK